MLRNNTAKRKSKHRIIANSSKNEHSNFKSGAIVLSTQNVLLESLKKINDLSGLPTPGQHIRIVTRSMINSLDFILAILAHNNIINLTAAFYRVSKKAITELKSLHEKGKIKNLMFLVNDGFPKLVPEAYNMLKSHESKNWKIKLENNHTKIILCDTGTDKYVIEGSGNLSINARIEQYTFDNNEDIYNFHLSWISKI
jgi:hypothetical protein